MEKAFNAKKLMVFLLFIAIMVLIISVFSLYQKDTETIVDGILVNMGANI